jgi:ATP-dependent RNA helicase DeaD
MPESFAQLGIRQELVDALVQKGIKEPTPVQEQAIGPLLKGKDVVAQAQTGTGKTLAFLLPILERVDVSRPSVQAVILSPTRELALQIAAETKKLAPVVGASVITAYGGVDMETQLRKLRQGAQIIVATPGRLLDHLTRGAVGLDKVSMLVLDEADEMLHLGFMPYVEEILARAPKARTTMLFSATMPEAIRNLARQFMRTPVQLHAAGKRITLDAIQQVMVETTDKEKLDLLAEKITEYNPYLGVIFVRTKLRADGIHTALLNRGFNVGVIHGDMSQSQREQVMKQFRAARLQLLVATDVMARGIDVEGVSHVFNYDMPKDVESYIHRIGRTGRAGHTGVAITFATPADREALRMIETGIHTTLERLNVQNLRAQRSEAGRKLRVARPGAPDADEAKPQREQRPEGVSRREFAKAKAQKEAYLNQVGVGGRRVSAGKGPAASDRGAKGPGGSQRGR